MPHRPATAGFPTDQGRDERVSLGARRPGCAPRPRIAGAAGDARARGMCRVAADPASRPARADARGQALRARPRVVPGLARHRRRPPSNGAVRSQPLQNKQNRKIKIFTDFQSPRTGRAAPSRRDDGDRPGGASGPVRSPPPGAGRAAATPDFPRTVDRTTGGPAAERGPRPPVMDAQPSAATDPERRAASHQGGRRVFRAEGVLE